jgi:hypothetical protein
METKVVVIENRNKLKSRRKKTIVKPELKFILVEEVIMKFIKYCHKIYSNLASITYNGLIINYYSINAFDVSSRTNNDKHNKIRESVIGAIINRLIPYDYYRYSLRWKNIIDETDKFIYDLCLTNKLTNNSQKCIHKAGRTHNYDLIIKLNDDKQFNVELKFNVQSVDEAPQFVSPMKPNEFNMILPDKHEYLHKIHSDKPKCMIEYQKKYYQGCKNSSKYTGLENDIIFYNRCKQLSEDSIKTFITNNDLKIDELTNYLLTSQNNKIYMLYKNGVIYSQCINRENYEIISYKKEPQLQSYVATTKTGITLKILLRWKNGNGVAYPAFQIS